MIKKKKIALIVDSDNWALANIAILIKKYINKYDFKIIPRLYFENNIGEIYIAAEDCDMIHFLWRLYLYNSNTEQITNYANELGFNYEEFVNRFINKPLSTAVYDHLYIDDEFEITKDIMSKCCKYYVSSKKLFDIYNKMNIENKPYGIITDGIDPDLFYPINLDRFNQIKKRKIVIGWVGNSEWGEKKEDNKGVNTIIKPAIKELKEEGYNITELFADRKDQMIPHEEMVNYYSKIDVLLCASITEGTPNPVLEAMACGVPIISTDVGIVPDVFGKKQKSFILRNRTKEDLKEAIKRLLSNCDYIKELSEENIKRIDKWKWNAIAERIESFFDDVLDTK